MTTRSVRLGAKALPGDLGVPAHALGLVVFVHGSGSSRLSPRNRYVAQTLQHRQLATLLFDLLTPAGDAELARLPVGLFGASTGAAAALRLAAERPQAVAAVVSRGGRPDLALPVLDRVRAPTLLVVGGHDQQVLELNREALAALRCEKRLDVVPGATHLFEEPGTLDAAARLAGDWFVTHLPRESCT